MLHALPRLRGRGALAGALILAASATAAGCGGSDSGSGGNDGGSGSQIQATTGEEVFKAANCSSCHTLAAAGAEGRIGPNLDDAKPSASLVKTFVTDGAGSMPSFKNRLSAAQIDAVSEYIDSVTGE